MSRPNTVRATLKAHVPAPLLSPYQRVHGRQIFTRGLRSTDLFVVGHPKSGNTWLTYMLAILVNKDVVGNINLGNMGTFAIHLHGRDKEIGQYKQLDSPRIFRTENPNYPGLYPHAIYLVRHPVAVLVSYFHHYKAVSGCEEEAFEDFVDDYLRNGCITCWEPWVVRWDIQVSAWLRRSRKSDRVAIVKYEDMIADRAAVLRRVAGFAGLPIVEVDLSVAVDRGGFDAMRKSEDRHGAEAYSNCHFRHSRFIRQGTADGWRSEAHPSIVRAIESEFRDVMRTVGYPVGV